MSNGGHQTSATTTKRWEGRTKLIGYLATYENTQSRVNHTTWGYKGEVLEEKTSLRTLLDG